MIKTILGAALVLGLATPALAERVGHAAAEHTQSSVLAHLHREHGLRWGTSSLRKVTAALSAGLAEQRASSSCESPCAPNGTTRGRSPIAPVSTACTALWSSVPRPLS